MDSKSLESLSAISSKTGEEQYGEYEEEEYGEIGGFRSSVNQVSMHPTNITGIDDQPVNPADLSVEELEVYIQAMELSNETINAENDLLQKYLQDLDPSLIDNMDAILDATTAAIHKAERTAQLGAMASVSSAVVASGMKGEDSSATTPRSSEKSAGGSSSGKVAAFTFTNKGPKIQPSTKMELIQREIDHLRDAYDEDKLRIDKEVFNCMCQKEASEITLKELEGHQRYLKECMEKEWIDKKTGKVPGEKMIMYFEMRIKMDTMLMKTIIGRRKNLGIQLDAMVGKLKELGDELKYVDYEQLIIKYDQVRSDLTQVLTKLDRLKRGNTISQASLIKARKELSKVNMDNKTTRENNEKYQKKIHDLEIDEIRIRNFISSRQKKMDRIVRVTKKYTSPDIIDYVKHKDQLHLVKKQLKALQNKNIISKKVSENESICDVQDLQEATINYRSKNLYRKSLVWDMNKAVCDT